MIAAVLLVPTDGDPLGLLNAGPCDSRPPIALEWQCPAHGRHWGAGLRMDAWAAEHFAHNVSTSRSGCRTALVLAWDGEPVAEGLDRARRCGVNWGPAWDDSETERRVQAYLRGDTSAAHIVDPRKFRGAVVLLDEHFVEATR